MNKQMNSQKRREICCAEKFQIMHGEVFLSGIEGNGQRNKYGLRILTSLQKAQQGKREEW